MHKAAMNILIQVFFCGYMYPLFFVINLFVELLGLNVDIRLTLLHISEQFFKVAVTFYTPPAKYESSSCSSSLSTLDIVGLSNWAILVGV